MLDAMLDVVTVTSARKVDQVSETPILYGPQAPGMALPRGIAEKT